MQIVNSSNTSPIAEMDKYQPVVSLTYLNLRDLLNCRAVCVHWKKLVSDVGQIQQVTAKLFEAFKESGIANNVNSKDFHYDDFHQEFYAGLCLIKVHLVVDLQQKNPLENPMTNPSDLTLFSQYLSDICPMMRTRTIFIATAKGHQPIVKVLAAAGDDFLGRNLALGAAAHMGHHGIAKILVDKGPLLREHLDGIIQAAALNGHQEIVALLEQADTF